MKKLILGIGTVICGLIILCTDYIINRIIGAMPNVYIIDGVAVFSLTVLGWILIVLGITVAAIGYFKE